MTNAHVVDGADEVLVTLTDKREFKARLIGYDKRTDVALLAIELVLIFLLLFGFVGMLPNLRLHRGLWLTTLWSQTYQSFEQVPLPNPSKVGGRHHPSTWARELPEFLRWTYPTPHSAP